MTVRCTRTARTFARLIARAYPRRTPLAPDPRDFLEEALDDAWRERGCRGVVRLVATVAGDLLGAWTGRGAFPISADTRPHSMGHRRSHMDRWLGDLRTSWRTLRHTPAFTVVAILTLALGIGATTAVYAVVDGAILRPFPYRDMDRLLVVMEVGRNGQLMSVSWPNFVDWTAQNDVFDEIGVYRAVPVTISGDGTPDRLNGFLVSSSIFTSMGIQPLAGRVFGAAEDAAGTARVAVISERLWRSRFGARQDVIGLSLSLNNEPFSVIGVMPAAMRYPSRTTDVWLPVGLYVNSFPSRGAHPGLTAIGRMKTSMTVEQARAGMVAIATRLAGQYPDTNLGNSVVVTPYYEWIVSSIRPALFMLLGAVGLLLLMACSNLASLMLARAETRERDLAVRAALGASRAQIVRQLLIEASLLAVAGGALGVGLAWLGVRSFVASRPSTIPRIDLIGVDWRILAFATLASALTILLFALFPAWRASKPDLQHTLRETRTGAGRRGTRLRRVLVAAQVGVAAVLLVGAGLLVKSLTQLMKVDLGFENTRVLTMRLTLPDASYGSADAWKAFHESLLQRLTGAPGLEAVGLNSAVPLGGFGSESPIMKDDDPPPSPDRPPMLCMFQATGGQYFEVLGIPTVIGRRFTDQDRAGSAQVAIIDDTTATKFFGATNPIGRRIAFEFSGEHGMSSFTPLWREVVGVVRHVKHYGLLQEPPYAQVYVPFGQLPTWMQSRRPSMALFVRTAGDGETSAGTVRRQVSEIDPRLPVYSIQTMETYVDGHTEQPRLNAWLVSGFAAVALLLTATGLYGVLSYIVSQRTREIGVRLALGASRLDIVRQIVLQGFAVVVIGLALGLAGAAGVARLLRTVLIGVSPADAATFAGVAALLAIVGGVASFIPARRASAADPLRALRMD